METLLQKCTVGIGILAVLLMISGCVGWGLCEGTGKCQGDATCEGIGECHVYGTCEGFATCVGTGTCKGTGTCEGIETDAGNGTMKCEGRSTCQGFGTCEGVGICNGSGKCKAGGTATCEGTGYCEGLGSCWPFGGIKDGPRPPTNDISLSLKMLQRDMNALTDCESWAPNVKSIYDPLTGYHLFEGADAETIRKCLKTNFGWFELVPPEWAPGTMAPPR